MHLRAALPSSSQYFRGPSFLLFLVLLHTSATSLSHPMHDHKLAAINSQAQERPYLHLFFQVYLQGLSWQKVILDQLGSISVTSVAAVVQVLSHVWLFVTMDRSTPGFPALHYLPYFAQTHVHWGGGAIQPSHPLLPPSPSCPQSFQHQGLF